MHHCNLRHSAYPCIAHRSPPSTCVSFLFAVYCTRPSSGNKPHIGLVPPRPSADSYYPSYPLLSAPLPTAPFVSAVPSRRLLPTRTWCRRSGHTPCAVNTHICFERMSSVFLFWYMCMTVHDSPCVSLPVRAVSIIRTRHLVRFLEQGVRYLTQPSYDCMFRHTLRVPRYSNSKLPHTYTYRNVIV